MVGAGPLHTPVPDPNGHRPPSPGAFRRHLSARTCDMALSSWGRPVFPWTLQDGPLASVSLVCAARRTVCALDPRGGGGEGKGVKWGEHEPE